MAAERTPLDLIIDDLTGQLPPADGTANPDANLRELFLELICLSLGNLYARMPLAGTLFERATLKTVISAIDENDSSKLTNKTEDWLRLEGIIRAAEGQKAYSLNRPSMAVLSTPTALGPLGDVMERINRAYGEGLVTPELRKSARRIGAYFLTRIARS